VLDFGTVVLVSITAFLDLHEKKPTILIINKSEVRKEKERVDGAFFKNKNLKII
jgi:hypothetical protein